MQVSPSALALSIRDARPEDAVDACDVMRASITQLCERDHDNDPATLADWLSNKTPVHVRLWIISPAYAIKLAHHRDRLVGLGALSASGEVTLLYVAPEARFRGVSKALLISLEAEARARGISTLTASSTTTAHKFFKMAGFRDHGTPVMGIGKAASYPLAKPLDD